jgi:hypothetical protein
MLDHRLKESPVIAKRGIPDTFRYLYQLLIDPTGHCFEGKMGVTEALNRKRNGALTFPYNKLYRAIASSQPAVDTLEWGN